MTLLSPLALAFAAVAVPIVLLYMLKLRRREQVISSTVLWRRAVQDVQASTPWQPPRPSVLLFLQLLALAALVLALARPAYTSARAFDGNLVVIVDQSDAMQAQDVRPSRFAEALKIAHHLAARLSGASQMSVIGMGAEPTLAIADSRDRQGIDRAIDGLRVEASSPNLLGALSLAASLTRAPAGGNTRVVVLTSRDSGISSLPFHVSFPVEIDRIGGRLRDLGITSFQAARASGHTETILRVDNFGPRPVSSDLNLYADGQLVDVRPLTVAPGQGQTEVWTRLPASIQSLSAHLTHRDDVRSDKTAWAVVSTSSAERVLLVSTGDYFLETALALDPAVQLDQVPPADYPASIPPSHYDLVVFDGTLPPALPSSSTLLINPQAGSVGGLTVRRSASVGTASFNPSVTGGPASLTQYVDLSDVHIARARDVALPGWLQPVITSGGRPLLAAGDDGSRRMAIFSFNLEESDWPLRVSFPILIQNVLHYLTPGLTLGTAGMTLGQPLRLFPSPGVEEIQVTRPDGRVDHVRAPFPPFTDTTQPGLYVAREIGVGTPSGSGSPAVTFAVNAFPARTAPSNGPQILSLGGKQGGTARHIDVSTEVAWVFGLLALAVLTAEWWAGARR